MTLDEFIVKYEGKHVEDDGKYLYQCVDLTKKYHREVIGGGKIMGNGVDYAQNPEPDYYQWRVNSPFYIPPMGSIAVWNGNVGSGFGHVAIVISASLMEFRSFDQNWPKGSPAMRVKHSYRNVVGFLVPKLQLNVEIVDGIVHDLKIFYVEHPEIQVK